MGVTKEDLQEKYSQMETGNLLEITANKLDYTELAVSVALEELKNRKVSPENINNYKSVLNYRPNDEHIENYLIDLNFFQKLGYYFLLVPLFKYRISYSFSFKNDFRTNSYVLKSQQANYYVVVGVSFLIIAGISSNVFNLSFLYLWLSGFVLSYLFDIGFNKARQINNIQEIITRGKNPLEF